MINLIAPLLLLVTLLLNMGCPTGIGYPLGQPGTEKTDTRLLGTWPSDKTDHDIQRIQIDKYDNYSYTIEVLETGSMYGVEDTEFRGWITKIGDRNFIFATPPIAEEYYTYCYVIDDEDQMHSFDVALMTGEPMPSPPQKPIEKRWKHPLKWPIA